MDKPLENNIIRFDWAMKRILRDKANFDILNGFLSVVLDQQVEIIELLESESNMDTQDDKFNRVDLKAKNEKGEIFIVEVQNTKEADYFHRICYGTSKAITEHLHRGQAYSEVKKVYSISIVYFNLGQGSDYAYHGTTEFKGMHHKEDILRLSDRQRELYDTEYPSGIFPEYYILKVNDFDRVATTPLDQWISFLGSGCIPAEYNAQGLEQARDKLRIDRLPAEDRAAYEAYSEFERSQRSSFFTARDEGERIGEARGIAIGEARGEQRKAFDIARKMLSKGMAVEDVAEMTGLSDEEISQMQ